MHSLACTQCYIGLHGTCLLAVSTLGIVRGYLNETFAVRWNNSVTIKLLGPTYYSNYTFGFFFCWVRSRIKSSYGKFQGMGKQKTWGTLERGS